MKQIIILAAFLIGSVGVFAQGRGPADAQGRKARQERIETMRVAYITKELNLTTAEAKAFWPLYNEYEAKRKAIRTRGERKGGLDVMSDKEVEQALYDRLNKEQEALDLKRDYIEQMRKIIPVRKVAKLSQVEKEFKAKVLKEVRNRREGASPQRGTRRNH